eukprot:2523969-Pleurochrysis_carterae.AAC.3
MTELKNGNPTLYVEPTIRVRPSLKHCQVLYCQGYFAYAVTIAADLCKIQKGPQRASMSNTRPPVKDSSN